MQTATVHELRIKRHKRLRKKVSGDVSRPRLAVFRSNKHISVQLIDDASGRTLAAASTYEKGLKIKDTGNVAAAQVIGKLIAERAKEKDIKKVVFDRGGNKYHGRVAAIAEAARESGLEL
jgi:large subunit ribosomal protein L18